MGTVWLARRSDGRYEGQAAVKLLNLALLDPVGSERFRREGTLLARLNHPNIARLLDAGVTDDGQPFLVLEYVEGTRIDRYCDERRLSPEARLRLFLDVLAAVSHAHANLIVHRDIKPSNVLVGADGTVKLLDFGIAKLLEDESQPGIATLLTREVGSALTPQYAAPEQLTGAPVTTATDVYALGALLYLLLTGRHPVGDAVASPADLVKAIVEIEPPRMSTVATQPPVRRLLSGDLDTIVVKALKKAPAERYATVTAFGDDLRHHLHNEPVTARRDSFLYRTKKFVVRHQLGLAAAASVIVALIAGTAIAVLQARESARQRDQALTQLRRAEATNDFSTFLLSFAKPSGKPISNAELLARGEALIGRRFAKDASLRVYMMLTLADRYFENQQYDARNRVLTQAYEDSRSISDVGLRSYATCEWASYFAERGDFAQAFRLLDGVLPSLSASPEYADFEANCRLFESIAASQANDGARAIRAGERALMLEERRGVPGSENEALSALGTAYRVGHRYNDAIRIFERAFALSESQGLENTQGAKTVLSNWSSTLQEMGQMVAAVAVAERAVRLARAEDSETGAGLTLLSTYGNALIAVGNYAEAATILEESLAKARVAGSPRRHLQTLPYAILLACESGDAERGARLVQEAYAVLDADKSATAYSKGIVDIGAARVALTTGEIARAVKLAERGLATLETATPTQAGLLLARLLFSRILNAAGRFCEALTSAEEGVEMVSNRIPGVEHSYQMGQALLEVATAKAGLGDVEAARATVATALEHLHATVGPKSSSVERAEALRQRIQASSGGSTRPPV
jgi:serine/threonine-protein kinase